jgi:branched-chain amino acid transport system substrate-binding protein
MSEPGTAKGISRRSFLHLAGAAAGTFALPSGLLAFGPSENSFASKRLTIRVMLPSSRLYPLMSGSYFDGMKLGIDRCMAGRACPELEKEDIAHVVPREQLKATAGEKTFDLITGLFNARVASGLSRPSAGAEIPFLASSVGESMISGSRKDAPAVHSLNYWQANWAMGRWAAQHLGKRTFIASSFYESGFDGIYAFRLGFESSGGRILGTGISHMPGAPDLSDILKEAGQLSPDFVYALYCGREAAEFIAGYASSGLSGRIALAGSPFMTDESVLEIAGPAAAGIKTCFPWAVTLDTPENKEFVTLFTRKTGRRPDAFALLGYETAGLIASATGQPRFAEALRESRFSGPRGIVTLADKTVPDSMFLREVRTSDGRMVNTIVSQVEADCPVSGQTAGTRSGWVNPYLCA